MYVISKKKQNSKVKWPLNPTELTVDTVDTCTTCHGTLDSLWKIDFKYKLIVGIF